MKVQLFEFSIFIMILIAVLGCTKEQDVNPPIWKPDFVVIDTTSVNYSFSGKISKVVYASLFGSYLPNYKIDLNQDSIADIEFSCSVYNHTVYNEWTASVNTLNKDVEIDIEKDTVLLAKYSKNYYDYSSKDSVPRFYEENYIKTKNYPSNVSITTKIVNYPVVHSLGDTINAHNTWNSGYFILKYDDHSDYLGTNIQNGIWRDIDRKFIGIRFLDKDSMYYYGWIELGVTDYRITLLNFGFNNLSK